MMSQSGFYGWKLVAAFWVIVFINLAFAAYGSPVMNAGMAQALHLSRTAAGLPYEVYTVMSAVPGVLVAALIRSIGVRRTVVLGSLLIVIGSLAMATVVDSAAGAAVAFGCVVGLGVCAGGPLGVQPGVVLWFVRRRALALAIVYAAGGVGGLVAARVLNWVIGAAHGNWRAGWWLFAALSAVAAVVAALFVRDRPADLGQAPDGIEGEAWGDPQAARSQELARAASRATVGAPAAGVTAAPARPAFITREEWTFGEVMASARFWVMSLALCGASAGYTLFLSQGILHLKDIGHTSTEAAIAVSVTTGSTLLGKVVLGLLGDRIDPRYIWVATAISFGVGLLLVIDPRTMLSIYAFSICVGFGFGGGLICLMTVVSNYYGPKVFPAAAGIAAALNTIISAVVAWIGGLVYDQLGIYAPTFYSLAGWCFLSAVALLLVRPPVRGPAAGAPAIAASPP
jgi:MFS family permease